MRLTIELGTGAVLSTKAATNAAGKVCLKRRDTDSIVIAFQSEDGTGLTALDSSYALAVSLRVSGVYTGNPLAYCDAWTYSATAKTYTGELDLNNADMEAAFAALTADTDDDLQCSLEVSISQDAGANWISTPRIPVTVENDVVTGSEAPPAPAASAWESPSAATVGEFLKADGAGHAQWAQIVSADVSDASIGGNLTADAGKIAKFDPDGALAPSLVKTPLLYIQDEDCDAISHQPYAGTGSYAVFEAKASGTNALTARTDGVPDNLIPANGNAPTILAALGGADRIATKTTHFTAAVYGRYISEGTVTVTDPTQRPDATALAAGDSYEVWIGSGTATIGGTAYGPSRFSIRRRYSGSAWATPTPYLTDALDLAASAKATTRTNLGLGDCATLNVGSAAGTVAAGNDARFPTIVYAEATQDDTVTNSTTNADATGASISLTAGTWLLEALHVVTATNGTAGARSRVLLSSACAVIGVNMAGDGNTGIPRFVTQSGSLTVIGETSVASTSTIHRPMVRVVVASGTVTAKLQFAEAAATSGQSAVSKAGSWIRATKVG